MRAGAEQIATAQIAAIDGVMRQHLRDAPVGMAETAMRQPYRTRARGAHGGGLEQYFELNIECAAGARAAAVEIGERLRLIRAASPRYAIGVERLERHDPGRDRGGEVLTQKRAEGLVFPGLQIARRPVIQQAQAEHVRFRLIDADARTE